MNNLKIFAVSVFIVFLGLVIFSERKKETAVRDVASVEEKAPEKEVVKKVVLAPEPKVVPTSKTNMSLLINKVGSIPEAKGLAKGELPRHEGRFVARLMDGKLLPPLKGSTKKLLFSEDPTHPDIETRAGKFFRAMGFDSDKKMKVVRGASYFLVNGESALKVEAFEVSYNWKGKPKNVTFLVRSTTGRYYRKLAEL
jgi:hypothetical protein